MKLSTMDMISILEGTTLTIYNVLHVYAEKINLFKVLGQNNPLFHRRGRGGYLPILPDILIILVQLHLKELLVAAINLITLKGKKAIELQLQWSKNCNCKPSMFSTTGDKEKTSQELQKLPDTSHLENQV